MIANQQNEIKDGSYENKHSMYTSGRKRSFCWRIAQAGKREICPCIIRVVLATIPAFCGLCPIDSETNQRNTAQNHTPVNSNPSFRVRSPMCVLVNLLRCKVSLLSVRPPSGSNPRNGWLKRANHGQSGNLKSKDCRHLLPIVVVVHIECLLPAPHRQRMS